MTALVGRLAALALAVAVAASAALATTAVEESQAWLEDARERLEQGDIRAAVIDLKNALQQHPDNAEARLLLGTLYVDLGQPLEAEKELNRARELGIAYQRVALPLGRALLLQGRFETLLGRFDATGKPDDLAFDILLLRAQAQAGLRRFEAAIDSLETAARLRPDDGRAWVVQARLYASLRRNEEAAQKVAQALEISPGLPDALLLSGDLRRQRGDAEGSLQDYGQVLEQEPDNAAARLGRAAALLVLARDEDAVADVREVLGATPDNPMARYLDAHIKLRAGDIEAAAEVMAGIGSALDRFPPADWLNGIIEYALGRYETARVLLDRYIVAVPDNVEARKLLGATLIRLNAAADAVEVLEPARAQAAEDPQLMALLGGAYLRTGRNAEAVKELEAAAERVPENPRLLSGLALGLLASGDTARAQANFDSALDLGLEDTAVGHLIALSHLNAGRFEDAVAVARELQERFPESPLPHNLEGAAHVGVGDLDKAREAIAEALRLDPALLSARLNLAALDARQGKLSGAKAGYLGVLEDEAGNVVAMSALAEIALREGDPQGAMDWRRKAYEVDTTALAPGLAYAQALGLAGDSEQAIAVIQRLRVAAPDQPALLNALGGLQVAEGRHEDAVASFRRLVEVTEGDPGARLRLAQVHLDGGDRARGLAAIEALVEDEPTYGPASVALTQMAMQAEGAEAALALARRFADANPDQAWGPQLIGDILAQQGRTEEAVAAYESGWAKEKSAGLAVALYRLRSRAGAGEAALASLRERLQVAPADQQVRGLLAGALIGLGRSAEAREAYETMIAASSSDPTVWNNLAWLYFEAGDARALEYAERALLLAPDEPAIMDTLAWIQLEQGELGQALRLLERADQAAPDQPEIGYHYAVALHRNGRDADAEVVLRRVLEGDRSFPSAKQAQALLDKVTGN